MPGRVDGSGDDQSLEPQLALMEESELLRKRLHAITEKHRLQETIRQKKRELDLMKVQLQRLKTKSLRDQWLLQDPTAASAQAQQIRELQLCIYSSEQELDSLDRQESIVSTNESFILNQLKEVEKSPWDIIQDALSRLSPDSFTLPDQIVQDLPAPFPPAVSEPTQPDWADREAETICGVKPVELVSAPFPVDEDALSSEEEDSPAGRTPDSQELLHQSGTELQEGERSLHALSLNCGGQEHRCVSGLSVGEVERLLGGLVLHCQVRRLDPPEKQERPPVERCGSEKDPNGDLNQQSCCGSTRSRCRLCEHGSPQRDFTHGPLQRDPTCRPPQRDPSHRLLQRDPTYEPPQRDPAPRNPTCRSRSCREPGGDRGELHHPLTPTRGADWSVGSPRLLNWAPPEELRGLGGGELVTAVFMGFQTALDVGGPALDRCLRAELVVIDDPDAPGEDRPAERPKDQPRGGTRGSGQIQRKHKSICCLC